MNFSEIIKDTARPDYWVPDAEAIRCHICKMQFGTAEELLAVNASNETPQSPQRTFKGGDCKRHHCRKCGQGVCSECSKSRRPVPERGWLDDVRVCDECINDATTVVAAPSSSISDSTTTTTYASNKLQSKAYYDDPKTKVE